MTVKQITVIGAGITGLWQALMLARAGHEVRLIEASPIPFTGSASSLAGAMLAPFCESEAAEPLVRDLGIEAKSIWLELFPDILVKGSLVLAQARDRSELFRFARMTDGHREVDDRRLAQLEPDLGGRFASGLFFAEEAHMTPLKAMTRLLAALRDAGVQVIFGTEWTFEMSKAALRDGGHIIDCRGMAARCELPDLRGVRGERVIIRSNDVTLSRPVRLLHPRHPLYIVPWPDVGNELTCASDARGLAEPAKGSGEVGQSHEAGQCYMIGSTLLESDDDGAMTLRAALEILGMAYALHPAFGEAEILDMAAAVRPAFPDNIPKAIVRGRHIYVNGMYRHGFLVAPVMAQIVAAYLDTGARREDVLIVEQE